MKRLPALVWAHVLAVSIALLVVLGTPGPASAHASLVATDPAEGAVLAQAPDEVTFTFDEPVQLVPDGLLGFDAGGDRIEVEASASGLEVTGELPEALTDGSYVFTWRVVSADGHPIAGSLTFHVGAPSAKIETPDLAPAEVGALSTLQAIVHGLNYAALLLAGGLAFFMAWTIRGIRLDPARRRRLVRLLSAAAGIAVLAAALAVPLSGAYQLGAGTGGVLDLGSLDPGLVTEDLIVLALQAIGLSVAVWSARRERTGLLIDLLTALAVWSPALVGHTRAYEPATLLVITDALHLSAGAVWLGGLAGLALCLPALAGRPRDAAHLLSRFSTLAAALLGVLAVTGVLLGWRIVGSWSGLVAETYGRLLLVKLALVLVVVAIAAWNRFRLLPLVGDGAGHERQRHAVALVRRVVLAEAAVLVVILAVTGFLTQKPPGGAPPVAPGTAKTDVAAAQAGDDLRVLVALDTGSGLQRQLTVQVQNAAGEPLDLYDAPGIALRTDAVDLGTIVSRPTGAGTYVADVVFPTTGVWVAQVSVRVDEFTSPVTTLEVLVE